MISSMTDTRARIGRLDVAIAAIASAVALVYMATEHWDDSLRVSLVAAPLFVGVTIPLLWRRVAPLAAVAASLAALLVHVGIYGDDAIRCGIVLPVSFLFAFAAGARLDLPRSLMAFALALGLAFAVCLTDAPTGADLAAMSFVGPISAVVWATGRLVRSRGRMVVELEARTSELRAARDERARLEVAGDRARLSAELDELLQRRLGELARLADGGGDVDMDVAAARLAAIEHESRRTLEEMRAVVGVLRSAEDSAPTAPQPALVQLDALLLRVKGAGARLTVEGNPRALPAGVELSAYRVVEHLLEALDDADDVEVRVGFADDALEISVAGPVRRRGVEAIERARERVALHSGTLQANTRDGRAEAVVSLPIFATV
jgi:hypothetical protein